MQDILTWVITTLNAAPLSGFVMNNAIVFPTLEMLHFLGLCLLYGALLVLDLRILGFAGAVPIERVERFARVALLGFAINLVTGLLFVAGDADRYLVNIAFWGKMGLIALAGLNTLYFAARIRPQMQAGVDSDALSGGARRVAWLSLCLWSGVIVLGRFIPYVEDL